MKQITIIIGLLSISLAGAIGQPNIMGTVPGKGIEIQTAARGVMTHLPMAPPETVGDVYLDPHWRSADITMKDEKTRINGLPVKCNLKTHALEIQYENQVKVLPGNRISHFTLLKVDGAREKFLNGDDYLFNALPVEGFLKVLDSGRWMLLLKPEVKIIESTYNPALHVGERNHQYVKDEILFLAKDNMLYEVELSDKKFCKQFTGREIELGKFLKQEKINLKKADDLDKVLEFLNEHI